MDSPSFFPRALGALLSVALLTFAGCASERPSGPPRSASRDARLAPIPLAGESTYFEGQIVAKITVGPQRLPAGARPERRPDSDHGSMDDFHGRPRRGGGPSGEFAGRPRGGPGVGGGSPTAAIQLSLTNTGPAPADVWISDFVSVLGNFAVRPEKLTLAPNQTAEVDAMQSRLGDRYTEIEAKLVLRLNGQAETQIMRLQPTTPVPPSPKS
jgi:hypothetical protein